MTRFIVPFQYGIKSYDLDVLLYSDMFVVNGPRVITVALGAKPFFFYKLTVDGAKTLTYNPDSELASEISSVLINHWSAGDLN